MMDALQPHLEFLAAHLLAVVFVASLVEAAGIPFPSRIVLIVAAMLASGGGELLGLMAATTTGALVGDHGPYVAGRLVGPRLLRVYCRVTLGSERCVENTIAYFRRFGAAALLLGRFVTSVRLFSAVLSGCGHISYRRFLAYDVVGTVVYAALWVTVGHLVGAPVAELLQRHTGLRFLILLVPATFLGLLGYRVWRRIRYGAARVTALEAGAACLEASPAPPIRRAG